MRHLSRVLRYLVMAVLALEAVYLVGANTLLLLVPGKANSQPEMMRVKFQAFSPFPGLVFVRSFSLRVQDPFVQWQLDVDRARVWLDLRSLRDRVLHATDVSTSGTSFRLRRKVLADEVTPELTLSQPPIEGYGAVGLRQEGGPPYIPKGPEAWTIRMESVSALADELWVDTFRYQGPMHATGAWSLHLDNEARVGPAQLELQGGTITRASQGVSSEVRGQLAVTIDPFPALNVPGAKILDYVDTKVSLTGALQDIAGTALALGASEKLAISGSPGRFALDGRLNEGVLDPGSRLSLDVPRATMKVGGLTAAGGAKSSAEVTKEGHVDIDVSATRLSLRDPDNGLEYVRNAAVRLTTAVSGSDVRALAPPKDARLVLTRSEIPKLRVLNQVLPEPLGLEVLGGSGSVKGRLHVDLVEGVGSGHVDVRLKDVALRQQEDSATGDIDVHLRVAGVRPDLRKVSLAGTQVSLRDMQVTSGRFRRAWGGEVKVSRASLNLDRREMFQGKVELSFDDARPFFRAMLDRTRVPRWAQKLFTPNDVRALADVGFGRGWVRVDDFTARVGRTWVSGVARLTSTKKDGAARLRTGALSAGLEVRGGKRYLKLLASPGWFAKQQSRVVGRQGG
ncbi:MAG: hypothetical protein WBV82_16685 [Myxococcaceae bacterium]